MPSHNKQYKHAPITEVVFDFKIDPILNVSPEDLEKIHSEISDEYPEKESFNIVSANIGINMDNDDPIEASTINKGIQGYRFWSEDKTQVCLFKLDGFSFSKLKPYENWDKSFSEAMRLWNIYKTKFNPDYIKRLAVRNINTLEIPSSLFEMEDYFVQPPQPPMKNYVSAQNFFSRFEIIIDSTNAIQAIITLTPQTLMKENSTTILFDTDVFINRANNYIKTSNNDQIKELFDLLRDAKNDIFEGALTQKMKDTFGGTL